ncbi:RidA family protein [Ramlibacter sp.]|uniref:RidA family protein n=1 Tax=Ramlibacter sp. TaxID=1917967 RepID=UPI003D0D05D8
MTASARTKRIVPVQGLAKPKGVWSTVTVASPGQLVFVSGLLSKDAEGNILGVGDVGKQTEVILENMKTALESAGATLADIVRVDVYITDMSNFEAIHAVRRRYFPQDPPASTMVQVTSLTDPRCLIEINAIASIPA